MVKKENLIKLSVRKEPCVVGVHNNYMLFLLIPCKLHYILLMQILIPQRLAVIGSHTYMFLKSYQTMLLLYASSSSLQTPSHVFLHYTDPIHMR